MKIGIIGCGWLGKKIADFFEAENEIFVTTTSSEKEKEFQSKGWKTVVINFNEEKIQPENLNWASINNLDSIIITVPFSKNANIPDLKKRFINLSLFLGQFSQPIFLMSSIGIYPQIELEISETTLPDDQLNASILCVENLMRENYPFVNILRLGGLMGGDRYLSKYRISEPYQRVNHVHYEDVCQVIKTMIKANSLAKTYNVVAPLHPSKIAIVNYQQNTTASTEKTNNLGRIISSANLQNELNYLFVWKNPLTFHTE